MKRILLGIVALTLVLTAEANAQTCPAPPFHSPDSIPCASWRPFGPSPVNQRVDGPVQLHANSARIVANLNSLGPVNHGRAGIADTSQDFYHPIFWANDTDPLWTIQGGSTVFPYNISGLQIHAPELIRPAGGSDRHLAVVVWWEGRPYEFGMWDVTIDRANHIIRPNTGRRLLIGGHGINGSCTNARFACLFGTIRYAELEAGMVNHALFATTNRLASGYVYPAMQGGSNNPGLNPNDWPQNGTRLRLDPAYATNTWLAQFPTWKRGVLRALRNYGAYFGDDSGSPLTLASFESGSGFTPWGADPFKTYAQANLGQSIFASGGVYYFDLRSGVDWSRLQVIASCVAEKTC